MIIDYKLTYPSGTATAVLINGFHTPQGDKMAKYTTFPDLLLIEPEFQFGFAVNISNSMSSQKAGSRLYKLFRN